MEKENKNLKIAIIGSRGIPNKYGGFESFTENLSASLVKKGYNVFVSCENSSELKPEEYNGVTLFYFPLKTPKSSRLRKVYEITYDIYSLFWASRNTDYVYMLGYSAGFFFFIPKMYRKKLWVNPDGLEWKRMKFNILIKILLKFNEKLTVFWADEIIADSKEIKKYFDSKYNTKSKFITYGVSEKQEIKWDPEKLPDTLKGKLNYNPNYYLIVSRLEPENNLHIILKAYIQSKTIKPLVIVGDFSSVKYKRIIEDILKNKPENMKIIFTGGIYNPETLDMIRQNCFAYLHGHSVGGTNPSLLEAMIMKNIIIAHNNEFNREVCSESALYFDDDLDLIGKFEILEENYEKYHKFKQEVYNLVKKEYSWDQIVNDYEKLFNGVFEDE
jgi:glycosyltransferase involved in cell wall biosynthesis